MIFFSSSIKYPICTTTRQSVYMRWIQYIKRSLTLYIIRCELNRNSTFMHHLLEIGDRITFVRNQFCKNIARVGSNYLPNRRRQCQWNGCLSTWALRLPCRLHSPLQPEFRHQNKIRSPITSVATSSTWPFLSEKKDLFEVTAELKIYCHMVF
jgi:hypothetical protein